MFTLCRCLDLKTQQISSMTTNLLKKTLLDIAELARGAVSEKFNAALTKVIANILDPNTNPCAVRKIVITFEFKPNMKREMAEVKTKVDVKLVSEEPCETSIFIEPGRNGQFSVTEYNGYEQEFIPGLKAVD